MVYIEKSNSLLCRENLIDCCFELINFQEGDLIHKEDIKNHSLVFCHKGHLRISSTLLHDEVLCAGEMMFLPRQSSCNGLVLSDTTLLVHRFNNTICKPENCILAYLYSHRNIQSKTHCYKLGTCASFNNLIGGIISYMADKTEDVALWRMKHKELIWILTRYYSAEELRAFFHSMTNEQISFKSLVLTHYRKVVYTDELAEMCGYGLCTFRRKFKKEFGIPPYKWLTMKRSEQIRYKLSLSYIPFCDIINEFDFSSPQYFNRFCKRFLGDTPTNLRARLSKQSPDK